MFNIDFFSALSGRRMAALCFGVFVVCSLKAQRSLEDLYQRAVANLPDKLEQADTLTQELLRQVSLKHMDNDSMLAKAYLMMGTVSYYRSRLVVAVSHYKSVLETEFGKGDNRIREAALNNLGVIYEKQNNIQGALDAHTASLRMAEKRMDSLGIVQSWINIGLLENKRANVQEAIRIMQRTLVDATRMRDTMGIALSHQNLGLFYMDIPGQQHTAKKHSELALSYFKALGYQHNVVAMLVNMAERENRMGDYARSDSLARQVLDYLEEGKPNEDAASAYLLLASNLIRRGKDFDLAEGYIQRASQISSQIGAVEKFPWIHHAKAELGARTGNFTLMRQSLEDFGAAIKELYGSEAALAEDQINRIRELDQLHHQRDELEDLVRLRNIQLWLLLGMLAMGATATVIILRQHARQKEYLKTLYRINLKEAVNLGFQANIASSTPAGQVDADPLIEDDAQLDDEPFTEPSKERFQAIVQLLEEERLFLDPDLSIQMLAMRLATNQKYISQAINEHSGTNFYGLLRRLRVNEARRMLLQAQGNVALQDVASRVGFSNRTTFHRQFKEETGLSPSEFAAMAKNA